MVQCFAADCNHQHMRDRCSFFRFPSERKDKKARAQWIRMCRRKDTEPNEFSRLCHCHFKDEKKKNGPTLFSWSREKRFDFPDPEVLRPSRKRKKVLHDGNEDRIDDDQPGQCPDPEVMSQPVSPDPQPSPISTATALILSLENDELRRRCGALESKLAAAAVGLSYASVKDSQSVLHNYTGLPSRAEFDALLHLCSRFNITYFSGWSVVSLPHAEQLLLTLMKLRCNFSHIDLAFRFKISTATVTNVTRTWIAVLHELLYKGMMSTLPSLTKVKQDMPGCFRPFPNCRLVLDCTEVQMAIPSQISDQSVTFSHYKQRNTLKGLVGIAPNCAIVFASKLYPGSCSDKAVVQHSGVMDLLSPGDMVMADKGFLIQDLLPAGVTLNIPPFLHSPQFTPEEAERTTSVARARVHVERAIQRIKIYSILDFIPHQYRSCASEIFQVCSALVSLQNPLLKEGGPAPALVSHPDDLSSPIRSTPHSVPTSKTPPPASPLHAPTSITLTAAHSIAASLPPAPTSSSLPTTSLPPAIPPPVTTVSTGKLSASRSTASGPSSSAAHSIAASLPPAPTSTSLPTTSLPPAIPPPVTTVSTGKLSASRSTASGPSSSGPTIRSFFFPKNQCQSRIDGRVHSNACTVISCLVVHRWLSRCGEIPLSIGNSLSSTLASEFVSILRDGNETYDGTGLLGLLGVYDAMDILGRGENPRKLVFRPHSDFGLRSQESLRDKLALCSEASKSSGHVLSGVLVQNPFSISFVFLPNGMALLYDSHSHGSRGALIAILNHGKWAEVAQFVSSLVGNIHDGHLCLLTLPPT